jgi:hypothetical protein
MMTIVRALLVGYAIIAIVTGMSGATVPYDATTTSPMDDTGSHF